DIVSPQGLEGHFWKLKQGFVSPQGLEGHFNELIRIFVKTLHKKAAPKNLRAAFYIIFSTDPYTSYKRKII
ncbi:hypothetical protein, partial [Bacillus xiapuensis]|nr:hypothetical protein [Bacillus xiapuensis]